MCEMIHSSVGVVETDSERRVDPPFCFVVSSLERRPPSLTVSHEEVLAVE
jgi:hypothetical protein